MISPKEVKILDINSEFFGVKDETLMENAGRNVAEVVIERFKPKHVTVFCGLGNNGGDGLVAARYLSRRCKVKVVMIDDPSKIKTQLAKKNFERLREILGESDIEVFDRNRVKTLIEESDVILDALLGIGLHGILREPYRSCVSEINRWIDDKILVSVDVPTGIGSDISIKPDITVTFHDIKDGMDEQGCGEIVVADIGIPEEAIRYVGPGEIKVLYPRNLPSSHKGQNGIVLVVGGGRYIGAPALSAISALRTGVDLVYLVTSSRVKDVLSEIIGRDPLLPLNLIVFSVFDDEIDLRSISKIEKFIERVDSILIGPGLGRNGEIEDAILKLVEIVRNKRKKMILDADAIRSVGRKIDLIKDTDTVVTPHSGEFFSLTGEGVPTDLNEREEVVRYWARKLGITILLKGEEDIISNGDRVKRNRIHHPAMTVGGTGDVLAGIVSSLLAKGVEPFYAACMGAFINGSAGKLAFEKYSYGMLATDIIEMIPEVLKKYL